MMTMEINTAGTVMQHSPCGHHAPEENLPAAISDFGTISLSGLGEAKAQLLTRVESKHLMTLGQCIALLGELGSSYRVLEVNTSKISRYETLYFDTSTFFTYLQHHNGKGNRYKLRVRQYTSSGEIYLEVKKKNHKGATEKSRIRTSWPSAGFMPDQEEFLKTAFPYDYHAFFPVLKTIYDRFTLVSKESPERITFDTNVTFRTGQGERHYPELVIGEIKYEKGLRNSPALAALHAMGIRKRAFSKYCIGVSLLYNWVKHNRFKPNLLFLSRLPCGGGISC